MAPAIQRDRKVVKLRKENVSLIAKNKRKILNDPVYGFITLRYDLVLDLIDHPWFQRLRRISQLGLSHLVYPGALHNRFHHAIGAMHLMDLALDEIQKKGHAITEEEHKGATIAILLHDIGHGPFSHALEHTIVAGVPHEDLSLMMMERLNTEFDGQLELAASIFKGTYHKKFLHDLVSSQLDMDRLDYLRRDSFYSGVTEGQVSSERIIKMLNVHNDRLVVEEKGIYSIEKFIVARRLMYWQVYLHKTVLSAEFMLVNILDRARKLASEGHDLFASPALRRFIYTQHAHDDFQQNPEVLDDFARLDDYDIWGAIKVWQEHDDFVLADLCQRISNRKLFKIRLRTEPYSASEIHAIKAKVQQSLGLDTEQLNSFFIHRSIDNRAYSKAAESILIQYKDGSVKDAVQASDHLNLAALSEVVEKHFVCYPEV